MESCALTLTLNCPNVCVQLVAHRRTTLYSVTNVVGGKYGLTRGGRMGGGMKRLGRTEREM